MPAVVRVATGATLPVVGGIVVAALTFAGAVVVVALRKAAPEWMLRSGIVALAFGVAITLAGVQYLFPSSSKPFLSIPARVCFEQDYLQLFLKMTQQ
jgi:hypothetical protein